MVDVNCALKVDIAERFPLSMISVSDSHSYPFYRAKLIHSKGVVKCFGFKFKIFLYLCQDFQ